MIVSHKHKYIFIKPKKIAGTSIEVSLSKSLGEQDIFPPLTSYSSAHDKDRYTVIHRNGKGFYDHEPPLRIKEKIGDTIFKNYFKFTVVRNPWDLVVSSYWWEVNKRVVLKDYLRVISLHGLIDYAKDYRKIKKPKSFSEFVGSLPEGYVNTDYYFYSNGRPIEDYYIRYEKLDSDFKNVCKRLKVPYFPLLSLKSKTRKSKKHFTEYYDSHTQQVVAEKYKREISYFKYKFK